MRKIYLYTKHFPIVTKYTVHNGKKVHFLIETRDLHGRCPPAVAAFPAPTSAYSLPVYLAINRVTDPLGRDKNTYRIGG
jgi:hypothetical protein